MTAELSTYELSEKLLSTPSDGIGPARKLADTLLHIQVNHNENRVTFSNNLRSNFYYLTSTTNSQRNEVIQLFNRRRDWAAERVA